MGFFQPIKRHSKLLGRTRVSIELLAVMEQGRGAALAYVFANRFHNLLRSERPSEDSFGELFSLLADDVALGAKFLS
jgi:hypothetical protein